MNQNGSADGRPTSPLRNGRRRERKELPRLAARLVRIMAPVDYADPRLVALAVLMEARVDLPVVGAVPGRDAVVRAVLVPPEQRHRAVVAPRLHHPLSGGARRLPVHPRLATVRRSAVDRHARTFD